MYLSTHRERWAGTVKIFFEAEEETRGGAKFMVEQGCLEHPRVDWVIGQHMNPRYPAGTFFAKAGFVSGASDEVCLRILGHSCHGAYPESGTDAIVIGAAGHYGLADPGEPQYQSPGQRGAYPGDGAGRQGQQHYLR